MTLWQIVVSSIETRRNERGPTAARGRDGAIDGRSPADGGSRAQAKRETIPFTTVTFFLLWLPSNVLISALVPSPIPQEMVDGRDLPVFTAAHIKGSLAM